MKAIILMAGMGQRLGKSIPKCLLELPRGETILGRQIRLLRPYCQEIIGVVGFQKELIMITHPEIRYVVNPLFSQTNNAASLRHAMEIVQKDDIIWINGDVVFTEKALRSLIDTSDNAVAVEFKKVYGEEMKFTIDEQGYIQSLSKTLPHASGEAVGIYKIRKKDFESFKDALRQCKATDYAPQAIMLAISKGLLFKAINVGIDQCIDVDFAFDLDQAWKMLEENEETPQKK